MKVWLWSALFLLSDGRRLQDEHYELNPTATSRMMKRFGQYLPKIEKSLQQQFLFRMPQRSLHARPWMQNQQSPFLQNFQLMQRAQNLGKYRFSTVRPKKGFSPNLLLVSRRLMSTKEALKFGKVFRDQMAKREMNSARLFREGREYMGCTAEQLKEFKRRFHSGSDGVLSYQNPKSSFTAMYIVTSEGGDHNGAFEGLEGGSKQQGFWSMCARLLQMSELYNVVYKRVENLNEATTFVHDVKKGGHFGEAIKHVTISGHGNPSTLVLGDDRLTSRELVSKHDTDSKDFLKELKPALIHDGEARSTVFLDSCSTGKTPPSGDKSLAQLVADTLPGVEVHAFEDLMWPKWIQLRSNFVQDAKFQCKTDIRGQGNQCLRASVFMSKDVSQPSLLQRSEKLASNSSDEEEFVFYDGVTFFADPQMCAEWCEMISECHLFEFVDLIEDETIEMGQCTLRVRDVDIVETESTGLTDIEEDFGEDFSNMEELD
ncbi:unnamed protein product [Durusdinium trenchii]|uniref:Uncharacterized protein n=2 Tax=Durusdinium trenchii TaxID=1381693 RepID=A0ABP0RJ51_9DINO